MCFSRRHHFIFALTWLSSVRGGVGLAVLVGGGFRLRCRSGGAASAGVESAVVSGAG